MTAAKTFYGNVPASFRAWWLEHIYPAQAAALRGDLAAGGGGILHQPLGGDSAELQRLRRFGATWSWWSVPQDLREYFWAQDG